jgi:hypothetical protein
VKNFVLSIKESLLKAIPVSAATQKSNTHIQLSNTQFVIDGFYKTLTEVVIKEPIIIQPKMHSDIPEVEVLVNYHRYLKAGNLTSAAALNLPQEDALSKLHQFIQRFDLSVLKGTYKKALDGNSQIVSLIRDGNKSLMLVKNANSFLISHFFCHVDGQCRLISNNEMYDMTLLEKVKAQLT